MERDESSPSEGIVEEGSADAAADEADEATASTTQAAISCWRQLPPLMEPQLLEKRRQAVGGSLVALSIGVILVGLTHGIALSIGFERHSRAWWTVLGLIYGEALTALLCLVGVLCVDPGVVPRSQETCFPIPVEMSDWLAVVCAEKDGNPQDERDGEEHATRPTELYLPSLDESSKDTYCTRCLVWRRSCPGRDIRYFHCNICQRCVGYFDHHCSVFGRCIAGTHTGRGNILFFHGLFVFGTMAYFTCLGSVLAGLVRVYGPKWVVPLFVVCVVLLHQCLPCYRGALSKMKGFCMGILFRKRPNQS